MKTIRTLVIVENDRGALVQEGRILLTRQYMLDSTRKGLQGLERIDYDFEQEYVTVLSPTLALLVAGGITNVTTSEGSSFSVRFAQSIVFSLENGNWKVLHAHRSFPSNR